MAIEINLKKNDTLLKKGFIGFSWTTLFFGFFVPLFRGDLKWLLIMLVVGIFTFGVGNLILCFIYNRIYTDALLEEGYKPADDFSRNILISKGMMM